MTTVTLGPYVTGERPDPLLHTFLDADGAVIDLTGYTASATLLLPRTVEGVVLDCTVATPTNGVVQVDFPDAGITVSGTHHLEVWVDEEDGRRYASQRFRFYARAALPVPTP